MGGRFERMGPNESSSGKQVAIKRSDGFNLKSSRGDLRQMKHGAEKAGFLVVVTRVGRLILERRAAGKRAGLTMVMHSARKHVYQ